MLYSKTADLSVSAVDPTTSLTLMSADIERITNGWQTMHEIWANTLEVALAIYLLGRQMGAACAVPVVVSFGTLRFNQEITSTLTDFSNSSFTVWVAGHNESGGLTPGVVA